VIEYFGRVTLLNIGLNTIGFSLLLALAGYTLEIYFLLTAGLCIYMFFFAISLGGVLFMYRAEILPAKTVMLSCVTQLIPNLLISYFTLDFMKKYGIFNLFMMFFIVTLIGGIYFRGMAVETKGKTKAQIQQEFKIKKFYK
jgi:hypothetical protein